METDKVFSSSSEISSFDVVILNFLGKQGAGQRVLDCTGGSFF